MAEKLRSPEDHAHTIAYGETALGLIKKNALPALPKIYELWYTYTAGFNNNLNSALRSLLDRKRSIDESDLEALYEKFIGNQKTTRRLIKVGNKITTEITTLRDQCRSSDTTFSSYGSLLEEVEAGLPGVQSREQLRQVANRLGDSTREATQANEALRERLANSHTMLETLRDDLESIRLESITDHLTNLYNRRHFDQALYEQFMNSRRDNTPLCLLMTDIDHFKKFNDSFGHQTGDQVLRLVAFKLRRCVTEKDIACRYGGEEFAIILPGKTVPEAARIAEKLRKTIAAKELVKRSSGEELGNVTISVGIACLQPQDDDTGALVKRADNALYAAKRAGRNRVCIGEDEPAPAPANAPWKAEAVS